MWLKDKQQNNIAHKKTSENKILDKSDIYIVQGFTNAS